MTSLARDQLLRTLSEDGGVSVRALVGSALVREAARRHETSPVATAALGRALLGTVLLASQGKDAETVEVRFRDTISKFEDFDVPAGEPAHR